jgi:hypothetical protein
MYRVPQAGLTEPAVVGRLERGVRPRVPHAQGGFQLKPGPTIEKCTVDTTQGPWPHVYPARHHGISAARLFNRQGLIRTEPLAVQWPVSSSGWLRGHGARGARPLCWRWPPVVLEELAVHNRRF